MLRNLRVSPDKPNKKKECKKNKNDTPLFLPASCRTDGECKHLGSMVQGVPVPNTIYTVQYAGVSLTGRDSGKCV